MAFKFGTTTLQQVIFNDTDLDKVYFKNGDNAAVLVFAKPGIYSGGNGQAVFGGKSFAYGENKNGTYFNNTNFSNVNATNMTGQALYSSSGPRVGHGIFVANKTFDISLYSKLTFSVTVSRVAGSTTSHGITAVLGLQTSCERAGTDSSTSSYYQLAGTHYTTTITGATGNPTTLTKELALATAKANGSAYYPFVEFTVGNLSSANNETWQIKINSITLS